MNMGPSSNQFLATISMTQANLDTKKVIEGFASLENGWHFGKGVAPSNNTISTAIELLRFSGDLGFTTTDAFPGVSGEINVVLHRFKNKIELIVAVDQTVSLYRELNHIEVAKAENLSVQNCKVALIGFAKEIFGWDWFISLALFSLANTISAITDSHGELTSMMVRASQSYANLARMKTVEISVSMPAQITGTVVATRWAESLPPSGSSPEIFFPQDGASFRGFIRTPQIGAIMRSKAQRTTS